MQSYTNILLQKKLVYPLLAPKKGDSRVLARQLDVVLLENGFKLSKDLLKHIAQRDFEIALGACQDLLSGVKALIGAHVKHNPYFIAFPKGVPDTHEFWGGLLTRYYEVTGQLTTNLLDFPTYGRAQHSFEDMEALHDQLVLKKGVNVKVINLGKDLHAELEGLFITLAGSPVPLSEDDRALLGRLFKDDASVNCDIPVRENRAIINALRLENDLPVDIDTVVDVLRLAAQLSGGDVTLLKPTKFKSIKRAHRRFILGAIDALIKRDDRKLDDVNRYKERFKRLAERLHPGEYAEYGYAQRVFDFAAGRVQVDTFGKQVHTSLTKLRESGNPTKALKVLSARPGMLAKNLDFILRNSEDYTKVIAALKEGGESISGRNLLGVYQHLTNRTREGGSRIFVNRAGKGYATENKLPRFTKISLKPVQSALLGALKDRIPKLDNLVVDWDSIAGIALPLSEKTKATGFEVLPRGSTMSLSDFTGGTSLRFFYHWHQKAERTDYDLSVQLYDADFNDTGQVSWTSLRYGEGGGTIVHSGDFTDATDGATEFIDIQLDKLPANVAYIVPSVFFFTGEKYTDLKESFFGYMEHPTGGKGQPFEPRTVKTRFNVRGDGANTTPMVFARGVDGSWSGKWMDLYGKGRGFGNRVEANKYSTLALMKSIMERDYLGLDELVKLYADRATKVIDVAKVPDKPVTYIGLRHPEGLHPDSTIYTLEQFKSLIPA